MWKRLYLEFCNSVRYSCEKGKYLASFIDNSVITCDEIIDGEESKTVTTNFDEKKQFVKHKLSIFYLP